MVMKQLHYNIALKTTDKPVVLVLTRQNVKTLTENVYEEVSKALISLVKQVKRY